MDAPNISLPSNKSLLEWGDKFESLKKDVSDNVLKATDEKLTEYNTKLEQIRIRLPKISQIIEYSPDAKNNLEHILDHLYNLGKSSLVKKEIQIKCRDIYKQLFKHLWCPVLAQDVKSNELIKDPSFNPAQHAESTLQLAHRLNESSNLAKKLDKKTVQGNNYRALFQHVLTTYFTKRNPIPQGYEIFIVLWEKIKKEKPLLLPKDVSHFLASNAMVIFEGRTEVPVYKLLLLGQQSPTIKNMIAEHVNERYLTLSLNNINKDSFLIIIDSEKLKNRSKLSAKEFAQLIVTAHQLELTDLRNTLTHELREKIANSQKYQISIYNHAFTGLYTPESIKEILKCQEILRSLTDVYYEVFKDVAVLDEKYNSVYHIPTIQDHYKKTLESNDGSVTRNILFASDLILKINKVSPQPELFAIILDHIVKRYADGFQSTLNHTSISVESVFTWLELFIKVANAQNKPQIWHNELSKIIKIVFDNTGRGWFAGDRKTDRVKLFTGLVKAIQNANPDLPAIQAEVPSTEIPNPSTQVVDDDDWVILDKRMKTLKEDSPNSSTIPIKLDLSDLPFSFEEILGLSGLHVTEITLKKSLFSDKQQKDIAVKLSPTKVVFSDATNSKTLPAAAGPQTKE